MYLHSVKAAKVGIWTPLLKTDIQLRM